MNYEVLLKKLTHLCAEMTAAGGSCDLITMRMNHICSSYGLTDSGFIINPNSVLASATAPDGRELTAIRAIDEIGQNFGKLNSLYSYSHTIPEKLPSPAEIEKEIARINGGKFQSTARTYLASIMLGTGFAIFYGCSITDIPVAVAACILIAFLSSVIKKYYPNLFFHNTVICLVMESMILAAAKYLGICKHPESVTLGVIMLLISGLSFSDGLWAVINKEITIGFYKLCNAVTGAIGIVIGTAIPIFLISGVTISGCNLNESLLIQLASCTMACAGFAMICCAEKKHVPAVALGACLAHLVYALVSKITPSIFISMTAATFAETLFAMYISGRLKIFPGIAHSVGILPLVPGSNLFYMLYGIISKNSDMGSAQAIKLITTCLGISFGFTLGRIVIYKKMMKMREKEENNK